MHWISVSESLPSYGEQVVLYNKDGYRVGRYLPSFYSPKGKWIDNQIYVIDNVTHWMPLPESPKV